MITAKEILEENFGGNLSAAARGTGISRASWSAWKNADFPVPLPPKLAAWVLSNLQPGQCSPVTPDKRVEASSPS
jgi:hypothetical protein